MKENVRSEMKNEKSRDWGVVFERLKNECVIDNLGS